MRKGFLLLWKKEKNEIREVAKKYSNDFNAVPLKDSH